ncbi:MAG TPA: Mur ligase domain-containing protein, partial [Verrucomicrobiae bacterium]|nr:Mur ligase domain-containing protein [Verrucomicrobiae bacterium]
MEERSLKFVAEAVGQASSLSDRQDACPTIKNVCIDSRQAKAGDLFFAIRGEKFDGHDFLDEVAEKNVAAIVAQASRLREPKFTGKMPVPLIAVDDTRIALGKLAAAYRKDFDLPVICVGGSNGKTTVKELLASVLRQKFSTLWSEASFNNDIG